MSKKEIIILPKHIKILSSLGENIKLARLRRKLSTTHISERADISRKTLWAIENGSPSVAIGYYLQVLVTLGLEKDLLKVAEDDILGKKLQDAELLTKKRSPKNINI